MRVRAPPAEVKEKVECDSIARVVEAAGGKVLIEVVTDKPENCEIFIEDGVMKGAKL